jgi:hypothetical protein
VFKEPDRTRAAVELERGHFVLRLPVWKAQLEDGRRSVAELDAGRKSGGARDVPFAESQLPPLDALAD